MYRLNNDPALPVYCSPQLLVGQGFERGVVDVTGPQLLVHLL